MALAAYHYVRQTEDVNLGVNASAKTLKNLTQILQKARYPATLRLADAKDPLGGVIDIEIPAGYL